MSSPSLLIVVVCLFVWLAQVHRWVSLGPSYSTGEAILPTAGFIVEYTYFHIAGFIVDYTLLQARLALQYKRVSERSLRTRAW